MLILFFVRFIDPAGYNRDIARSVTLPEARDADPKASSLTNDLSESSRYGDSNIPRRHT